MGKKIAIVQSNYIPWKGYFDLINSVDEFILFDDMQYTRRDWRNRNRIKTPTGTTWLTIPVCVKGKYFQKINETRISDPDWAAQHWKSLTHSYRRAKCFHEFEDRFHHLYETATNQDFLSQINYLFIQEICQILKIKTLISWSSDYQLVEGKTERLISLCQQAQASEYVSGPSAQDYLDLQTFSHEGIKVTFFDYSQYPEYEQLFPPFEHSVSILDLILNEGDNAYKFMKSF